MPPEQYPVLIDRDQDRPQVGWITNILMSVLGDMCVRKKLAPNLAATSADIKTLVRSRFRGEIELPKILLTEGWRSLHILPELLSVLEGQRNVRISDLKSDTPLLLE